MVPPPPDLENAPDAADDTERRIVSVLFADLSGSLRLIRGLDPEDARDLLDEALARMSAAVTRFDGIVAQTMGDGLMAIFGGRTAQEDHAVRACRAALALNEALRAPVRDRVLSARVGLHAGEVAVRSGRGPEEGALRAVGEAVHLASRIQASAEQGTVRASLALCRLAGEGLEVRRLGAVRLRGAPRPVELAELLAVPPGPLPRRAGATPLVNRGHELGVLGAALDAALAGTGRVAVLVGEPGCGKSRLVRECAAAAEGRGVAVHQAGCAADSVATGYQPLRTLMRRMLGIADGDLPDAGAVGAALRVCGLADPADGIAGPLAALLGTPDPAWQGLSALDRSRQLAAALRAAVAACARHAPMLAVVEDIHWADAETMALLESVAADAASLPMLLLVTRRPEGPAPWPDLPHGMALPVNLLSGADAVRLTEVLLGADAAASAIGPLLTQRAGGNPFFAEELVTALAERGLLAGGTGDWHAEAEAAPESVPATVRGLLTARLSLLDTSDKRLLEAAAVLGREFDAALLPAVLGQSEGTVTEALARLSGAQFVVAGADPGRWAFRHALTQEAVLAGLSRGRRRALHAAVLAQLEQAPPGPERAPEVLARHAQGAQDWLKAAEHAREAAEAAFARYANGTAVEFFDQAIAAAARAGDDPVVLRMGLDLRLRQRDALFRLGRTKQVRKRLEEAARLAEKPDVADDARRAQVALFQAHINWLTGRYKRAQAAIDRATEVQKRLDDPQLGLRIRYECAAVAMAEGRLAMASAEMRAIAMAISQHAARTVRYGIDFSLAATAASYAARSAADLGDASAATEAAMISREAATAWRSPFPSIFAQLAAGAAALVRNDLKTAEEALIVARQLCQQADAMLMMPSAMMLLGACHLRQRDRRALEALHLAVGLAAGMGFQFQQPQRLRMLAMAESMFGSPEAALRLEATARKLAHRQYETQALEQSTRWMQSLPQQ